jgi:putative NADH-flavin reductase
MKILLLGATGRTGKLVVDEALRQGHELICLVRKPEAIHTRHKQLTIYQGSPERLGDLEGAIQGCEVVITVLNISRNSDFPWSSLRTPKTLLSDVITNLITLSETHVISRLIACSAWGASETKKYLPRSFVWLMDHSNVGFAYRDHERQEELLMKSSLPWTIVRPTGLTNSKRNQEIIESFDNIPKPNFTISRLSVARYSVDAISNKALIHQRPVISSATLW